MSDAFEARYGGICCRCDERIMPGELVQYDDGDLVHDICVAPSDPDEPQRNEKRCPDCFCVHAGDCL